MNKRSLAAHSTAMLLKQQIPTSITSRSTKTAALLSTTSTRASRRFSKQKLSQINKSGFMLSKASSVWMSKHLYSNCNSATWTSLYRYQSTWTSTTTLWDMMKGIEHNASMAKVTGGKSRRPKSLKSCITSTILKSNLSRTRARLNCSMSTRTFRTTSGHKDSTTRCSNNISTRHSSFIIYSSSNMLKFPRNKWTSTSTQRRKPSQICSNIMRNKWTISPWIPSSRHGGQRPKCSMASLSI